MVSREDAVASIIFVINQHNATGIWNVVHPDHPLRFSFYEKAASFLEIELQIPEDRHEVDGKIIQSARLLDAKFQFDPRELIIQVKEIR
jgi:NAD dependent epimerase/dehydratase family enzyme